MKQSSAEQIRRIAASDRKAFDRLFRSIYPALVRYAFRYVKNRAIAGDIVQDAFVKLWEKRRELDPSGSVKAYMYRIVRNRALNYIRDHSNESVGLEHAEDIEVDPTIQVDGNADGSDELFQLLREWINELPERQREAFELSRFEGLDHEEIAGVMEVSPNTVNNHIVAALGNLRTCYDAYHNEVNEE